MHFSRGEAEKVWRNNVGIILKQQGQTWCVLAAAAKNCRSAKVGLIYIMENVMIYRLHS